jgi:hypothetical protein
MKLKILFLLLISILNNTLKAQTTYIPDDNFEQALIDLGYDDIIDNQVLTDNISSITYLNLSNKSISDLTGIEDFTSLYEFPVMNNNITSIDLSQNTELRYLYVSGNTQLSQLNTNQLPFLRDLFCSNTGIISFDLSQNPNLGELTCSNTSITSLDLSNNSNIHSISASNNNLQNVDLRNGNNNNIGGNSWNFRFTNNPNLPFIYVDDCAYSTNNWTNIDSTTIFIENEGETECENLSVWDYSFDKNIILFPNPTKNNLTLNNINNITINSISISNPQGELIIKIINNFEQIDLSNFNTGIYFLTIDTEKGFLTKKIVRK